MTPDPQAPFWHPWRALPGVELSAQTEGDLGARMAAAAARGLNQGTPVLLIGTDCPGLDRHRLRALAAQLSRHDACLCPVRDGGYALLGLRHFAAELFSQIPWSTDQVAALTRQRLTLLGWRWHESEPLQDLDHPEDLTLLRQESPQLAEALS